MQQTIVIQNKGFTLIEMSIVLVIIGLVIGGVLLGQSLIRQSQINSIGIDAQKYIQAGLQFQQKYNALPGDFANATTYWGAMTTCPPVAGQTSQGGTLTCNGDGNGQVNNAAGTANWESFLFWQHLANAQLIAGQYTGIAGSGNTLNHVIGVNSPATKLNAAGFGIYYLGTYSDTNFYPAQYGHALFFGGYTANNIPYSAVITAQEAYALDVKFDDGLPAFGQIMSYTPASSLTSCTTSSTSASATYNFSAVGPQCSLIFITGF